MKKKIIFIIYTMVVAFMLLSNIKVNALVSPNNDTFDEMRLNWQKYLIGDTSDYKTNSKVRNAISAHDKETKKIWEDMQKNESKPYLWESLSSYTESSQITRSYDNLETMAISYRTDGSKYYLNKDLKKDILFGLEWMYKNKYNERTEITGNWWDYEVGAPTNLNDIIVIMYKDIAEKNKERYLKAVNHFTPNAKYFTYKGTELTPANILYKAKVVMIYAILTKDEKKLTDMRSIVATTYKTTDSGAGFYEDGSFIEHKYFAYNGGYGAVMLKISSEMMMELDKTKWSYTSAEKKVISDWVVRSFEPFIYNGVFLDMVRGRQLTTQDVYAARSSVISILLLSDYVEEPYKSKFKSLIKGWNRQNGINYSTDAVYNVKMLDELYKDDSIQPASDYSKHQTFGAMDRVLHGNGAYLFGIAMSSNRIASYESINGENLNGWYTGQGMTYLYNGDGSQYSGSYWITVDRKRLPGTTIEQKTLTNKYGKNYLNGKDWVGGSQVEDKYGSAGMEIGTYGSTLQRKKSWFMFDNEIVALGADLQSQSNSLVETIIDNRKLTNINTTIISSDSKVGTNAVDNPKWIQITDPEQDTKIGYYFPDSNEINVKKEVRTGRISDIDLYKRGAVKKDAYFTMWINHGSNVKDGKYSYAILPNKSANAMKDYASKPEFSILRNDADVQAVKEYTTKVTGMNFWNKGTVSGVTSYQSSSITMMDDKGVLSLGVSDPTQKQSKVVVEINKVGIKKIEGDDSIKVLQLYPTIKLEVDTKAKLGASQQIKIKYDDQSQVQKIYAYNDSFVRNGTYKNTNFGSKSTIEVKNAGENYNREGYLKFDLSNISASNVTYASLNIIGNVSDSNGSTSVVSLYSANTDWGEEKITWNNKPGKKEEISKANIDSEMKERLFNITDYAKKNSGKTQSFALVQKEKENATFFETRESDNKPYIVIITKNE